jgi:hypothetical protein
MMTDQANNQEIQTEFYEQLKEYSEWVGKKISPTNDWLEEIEYIIFSRGELHDLVVEIEKRKLDIDMEKLREVDKEWQKWISEHAAADFVLEHSGNEVSKGFWWEWIDQLNSLTPEQKSAL